MRHSRACDVTKTDSLETDSLDEPDSAETQLKVVSSLPDPAQLANRQQTTELALLCDTERDVMRQWDLLNRLCLSLTLASQ
jgi:hypothetical protein